MATDQHGAPVSSRRPTSERASRAEAFILRYHHRTESRRSRIGVVTFSYHELTDMFLYNSCRVKGSVLLVLASLAGFDALLYQKIWSGSNHLGPEYAGDTRFLSVARRRFSQDFNNRRQRVF